MEDSAMRDGAVVAGKPDNRIAHHLLRKWLEQEGIQLGGTVRGARAARVIELAWQALDVQSAVLAPRSSVGQFTNNADDNCTDDA